MKVAGDMEPSQYSPSTGSLINDKPVTLKLDLGGNIWIVGRIEGPRMLLLKIRFTKWNEVSIMARRENMRWRKACAKLATFREACFTGKMPKKPIRLDIVGDKEPSQYSPSSQSTINDKPVQLKLDLGGNVWIMGRVDGDLLTMVKLRFTRWNEGTILGKRHTNKYLKACDKQRTFTESCFVGEIDYQEPIPDEEPSNPDTGDEDATATTASSATSGTTTATATRRTATTTTTIATTTSTATTESVTTEETTEATTATTAITVETEDETTEATTDTAATTTTTAPTTTTTPAEETDSTEEMTTTSAEETENAGEINQEAAAAAQDLLRGPRRREPLIPRTTDHPEINDTPKLSDNDSQGSRP